MPTNQIEQAMEPRPEDPNARVSGRVDRFTQWLAQCIRTLMHSRTGDR